MVPVLVLGMVFGRVLALLLQGQWRAMAMIDFLAWVPSLVLVLQLQLGEGKPVLR